MVTRTPTGFEITCDGKRCQEFLEIDSDNHDWKDAMAGMYEANWRSLKDRQGNWGHYCPECRP